MKKNFKNLIIIISLILIHNSTFSQDHNLQFNQIKLINSEETVPVGKVWKVVSTLASSNLMVTDNNCTNYTPESRTSSILINGTNIYVGLVFAGNTSCSNPVSSSIGNLTVFPFWIPEGTIINIGSGVGFISTVID